MEEPVILGTDRSSHKQTVDYLCFFVCAVKITSEKRRETTYEKNNFSNIGFNLTCINS